MLRRKPVARGRGEVARRGPGRGRRRRGDRRAVAAAAAPAAPRCAAPPGRPASPTRATRGRPPEEAGGRRDGRSSPARGRRRADPPAARPGRRNARRGRDRPGSATSAASCPVRRFSAAVCSSAVAAIHCSASATASSTSEAMSSGPAVGSAIPLVLPSAAGAPTARRRNAVTIRKRGHRGCANSGMPRNRCLGRRQSPERMGVCGMSRMLKVFASGAEQNDVAARYQVVETYPAFVVVDVSDGRREHAGRRSPRRGHHGPVRDTARRRRVRRPSTSSLPRITARGTTAAHPDYKGSKRLTPGPHHYLVQFAGPVKPEWLDAVSDAGGEVVDTYAGFTVVVRADDTQIAQIAQLPVVRWAGHLPPDARVSIADPDAPPLPRTKLLPDTVTVEFFTPREARKGRAEIRNLGLRITSAEVEAGVLVVELPEGTAASQRRLIEAISQIHGVRMVRRKALNRISNDIAVGPMRAGGSALGGATNIDGAGEIVAICDTGFDIGTTTPAHPDFVGRVKSIKSYPITSDFAEYIRNPGGDDGAADLDSGHGTHVTGSVLGDGTASAALAGQAPIRGIAHKARSGVPGGRAGVGLEEPGAPPALRQVPAGRDPRRHLHALPRCVPEGRAHPLELLGRRRAGRRTTASRANSTSTSGTTRRCASSSPPATTAATPTATARSISDPSHRRGPPRTASRSGRARTSGMRSTPSCTARGGRTTTRRRRTRAHRWPTIPIRSSRSRVVGRPPTGGRSPRSSLPARGSCRPSRRCSARRPTDGVASRSRRSTSSWVARAWRRRSRRGRSLPSASTCAAIFVILSPSAALLKAVVIAGALRLPNTAPARDGGRQPSGIRARRPRRGRRSRGAGTKLWVRQNTNVATGQSRRRTVTVKTAGAPLRIVLAYSDFPGANLVNNLNLVVTAPDGTNACRQPTRRRSAHVRHGEQRRGRAGGQRSRWHLDHRCDRIERAAGTAALRAGGARQAGLTPSAPSAPSARSGLPQPLSGLRFRASAETNGSPQRRVGRWTGPTRRRPRARRRRARGRSCRGHPACPPRV